MKTIKIDIKQGTQMNISSINSARQRPRAKKHGSPGRLKQLSQSIMVGLLSVSMLLPGVQAQIQPVITGQIATPTVMPAEIYSDRYQPMAAIENQHSRHSISSRVKLPNTEYTETTLDMQVKILGGTVKLERTWMNGRWYLNTAWVNLRFVADSLDGSIKTIDRAGTLFERNGNSSQYSSGDISINKTDEGWRWYNRNNDWISYDNAGRMTSYGDKNGVQVMFVLDAQGRRTAIQDRHGETIYRFEYDANELLTRIVDKENRSVSYTWQGERLVGVSDVLGNLWQYQYNSDGQIVQRIEPDNGVMKIAYSYSMPAAKPAMVSGIHSGLIEESSVVTSDRNYIDNKIARVGRLTDKTGAITLYQTTYDKANKSYTITVEDSIGRETVSHFDHNGKRLSTSIDGVLQSYIVRDGDRETKTINAKGQATIVRYDVNKQPIQVIHPDGSMERYEYDNVWNRLLRSVDALGNVTVWQYDDKGNVIKLIQAQGKPEQREIVCTYDNDSQLIAVQIKGISNGVPSVIKYNLSYNQQGNVISITDNDGNISSLDYNIQGQIISVTNALGYTWLYEYNSAGHLTSFIDPLQQKTQYFTDAFGRVVKEINPSGNELTQSYHYGNEEWWIEKTDALNHTTKYRYNSLGHILEQTTASGNIMKWNYNDSGQLIQTIDAAENTISYQYGQSGSLLDGLLIERNYPTYSEKYQYNTQGKIVQTEQILDENTVRAFSSSYDEAGRLATITEMGGQTSQFEYDAFNNIISVIDAIGGKTVFERDMLGKVTHMTNANGDTYGFEYDNKGNLVKEISPAGKTKEYGYNEINQQILRKDAEGNTLRSQYDAVGRLIQSEYVLPDISEPQQTVVYRYTPTNQLTEMIQSGSVNTRFAYEWNAQGKKIKETVVYADGGDEVTMTLHYGYDADGRKNSMTYPDGSVQTYIYENERLKEVVLPNARTMTWDNYQWMQPTEVNSPGSSKLVSYDALQRVESWNVKNTNNNTSLMSENYVYGIAGNLAERGTDGGEYHYRYDALDRLTQVMPSFGLQQNGAAIESYTYDAIGNRLGSSQQPGSWQYDANQLVQFGEGQQQVSYTYTENGNVKTETRGGTTRTYHYDAADKLVLVNEDEREIARYAYDPMGRRIEKVVNGETTWYLYSDEGLIAELDSRGNMTKAYGWQANAGWGTSPLWQADVIANKLSTAKYYSLYTDRLGTPKIAVDSSGQVVWRSETQAFGETQLSSDNTIVVNLRFPGQYYDDELNMNYNYFRHYSPEIGRYIQSDPLGLAGGVNAYEYGIHNPLMMIDPLGLKANSACVAAWTFGGAAVGSGVGRWGGGAVGTTLGGAGAGLVCSPAIGVGTITCGAAGATAGAAAGQKVGTWAGGILGGWFGGIIGSMVCSDAEECEPEENQEGL